MYLCNIMYKIVRGITCMHDECVSYIMTDNILSW